MKVVSVVSSVVGSLILIVMDVVLGEVLDHLLTTIGILGLLISAILCIPSALTKFSDRGW